MSEIPQKNISLEAGNTKPQSKEQVKSEYEKFKGLINNNESLGELLSNKESFVSSKLAALTIAAEKVNDSALSAKIEALKNKYDRLKKDHTKTSNEFNAYWGDFRR